MKRCTTCNRTYTDPNLSFCIDDGTPLTAVEPDDDTTVITPRNPESEWNASAYQPPRSYVPPGGNVKRRRAWPWIVGIFGAFILGILVIGIAAAILAPRIARRVEHAQSNINRIDNTNTAPETNNNSNTNTTTEHTEAPVPTDHDQVLAQLKDIENDWTVANINADKKKLDRILADDFVGQTNGQMESKSDYIRTIERDPGISKWDFSNLKLTLTGDRATLTGRLTLFEEDRRPTYDFTDKFVWRDGRWQATSSETKETQNPGVDL